MATLTFQQVKEILLNKPNKELVTVAQNMSKKLSTHINGEGLKEYLAQIETYEKPEAVALRRKYAKSNKDLFERLARPVDKVFSARGGSKAYKIAGAKEKALLAILEDVDKGFKISRWVESFWLRRYFDDPMGLIFMEVDVDRTYPTYKSSADIVDYGLNGRKLDYVVFKTNEPNIFRVVDDSFDALYKVNNQSVTQLRKDGSTYANYFGFVPGIIVSDIPKDGRTDIFASPFDGIIELADEFLVDGSVRKIYKFKHGFPKAWKYIESCGECKGTGYNDKESCKSCNGTGKKLNSDPSDVMVIDYPSKDDHKLAPELAGYITPDLEYLINSGEELKALEDLMMQTHWGTHQKDDTENETATGRFIDVQPVNDRLNKYSDAAQYVEQFITDAIGLFTFQTAYNGSYISYGRRFLIESADTILKKYETLRKSGAPQHILDDILIEAIEAKYSNNTTAIAKFTKLARLEPYVHLTIMEAKLAIFDQREYAMKLYFGEFISTKTDVEIASKPLQILRQELMEFATNKTKDVVPMVNTFTPSLAAGGGATTGSGDVVPGESKPSNAVA
jgi:hypothetical protein